MGWYYNTSSGMLTKQTGTVADITGFFNTLAAPLTGWHKLHIGDNASFAQAAKEAEREFPKAATPTGSTGQAANQQVSSEVPGGSALVTTGQFLTKLNQRETWVRIVEVGLGAGLVFVALGHLTGVGTKTPIMKGLKVGKGVVHKVRKT